MLQLHIYVAEPHQLEVEIIDVDDIDEGSEFYNTAKNAKTKQGDDNKQLKTVIAVLVS